MLGNSDTTVWKHTLNRCPKCSRALGTYFICLWQHSFNILDTTRLSKQLRIQCTLPSSPSSFEIGSASIRQEKRCNSTQDWNTFFLMSNWKLFEGEMPLKKYILVNFPCFTRWNRKNMGKTWKYSPFRCWVMYCWSKWRSNVANPPEKAVNEHKHLPKSLEVTWLKSCHTNKPETLRDSSYAGPTLGIQIAQIQPAVAFLHLSFLAMFVRCFESLGRSWDATFERRFLDPFSHLLISKTLPASRGASVACNTTLTTHLSHLTWHPFD